MFKTLLLSAFFSFLVLFQMHKTAIYLKKLLSFTELNDVETITTGYWLTMPVELLVTI
jgi:hypothetical protein